MPVRSSRESYNAYQRELMRRLRAAKRASNASSNGAASSPSNSSNEIAELKAEVAALRRELEQARTVDTSGLGTTAKAKLAARERKIRAELERSFEQRVVAEARARFMEAMQDYMTQTRATLEEAEEIIGRRQHPFTKAEFISIRNALHPNCPTDSPLRNGTYILFTNKERLLCPSEDSKPFTSTLPKTREELQRQKEEMRRKRQAARKGG
jgi:hypothetical protein